MAVCPKCRGQIMAGAVVCKHCGATLGVPVRPTGVTLAAAVVVLIGVYSLLVGISSTSFTSISRILWPSLAAILAEMLTLLGVDIYCAIGLLQLKRVARLVCFWVAGYRMVAVVISVVVISDIVTREVPTASKGVLQIGLMLVAVCWLALYGLVLGYLVRRKDYFVK